MEREGWREGWTSDGGIFASFEHVSVQPLTSSSTPPLTSSPTPLLLRATFPFFVEISGRVVA